MTDPNGLGVWMRRFITALRVRGFSEHTLKMREHNLVSFIEWLNARSITKPVGVTKPIVEAYQRHLYYRRKDNGQPLSFVTQQAALIAIRMYFRWLAKENVILSNPASDIELPKVTMRLPRQVLTAAEAEAVLSQADVTTDIGIRDRAILETLYSTGMRRGELLNLSLFDLDFERGTVLIRQGKGNKDRFVPIGERAVRWIDRYVKEVRPRLVTDPNDTRLFVTKDGEAFSDGSLSTLAATYIKRANVGKKGACHIFRHTMATVMLENGADVRFIQAMLGHADLSSTEIYTHVAIRQLKAVHAMTHPSARLDRKKPSASEKAEAVAVVKEDDREALLSKLDAEDDADA